MKDRVEKLQPHRIADWRATILETWVGLSQNYIDNLVTSMPRRIEQCIERQGGSHGLLTTYFIRMKVRCTQSYVLHVSAILENKY